MREILFRGKDIKGNWHIGLLAHIGNAWYISNKAGVATAFEVIPETIGQYTGLTDKNGKKIFEGDIVKYSIYPPNEFEYGVANWNHGGFRAGEQSCNLCVCSADGVSEYSLTVIGNIHDNPELLKEGADNG